MNNDIVTKARLNAALGTEGNMGFEHNDIVTVDKMNEAIAEGGGGGGSSDLSTAQVTIAISGDIDNVSYYMPMYVSDDEFSGSFVENDINRDGSPATVSCILHQGLAVFYINAEHTLTGSGNVEIDGTSAYITGDCTITIS